MATSPSVEETVAVSGLPVAQEKDMASSDGTPASTEEEEEEEEEEDPRTDDQKGDAMDVVNTSLEEAIGVFKTTSEALKTSLDHQVSSKPLKKLNVDEEMKEEVETDIQEMNPSQARNETVNSKENEVEEKNPSSQFSEASIDVKEGEDKEVSEHAENPGKAEASQVQKIETEEEDPYDLSASGKNYFQYVQDANNNSVEKEKDVANEKEQSSFHFMNHPLIFAGLAIAAAGVALASIARASFWSK